MEGGRRIERGDEREGGLKERKSREGGRSGGRGRAPRIKFL